MKNKIDDLLGVVEKAEKLNDSPLLERLDGEQFGLLSIYLSKLKLGIEDIMEHNLEQMQHFSGCDSSVLSGLVAILDYVGNVRDDAEQYNTDVIEDITDSVVRLVSSVLEQLELERCTLAINGVLEME